MYWAHVRPQWNSPKLLYQLFPPYAAYGRRIMRSRSRSFWDGQYRRGQGACRAGYNGCILPICLRTFGTLRWGVRGKSCFFEYLAIFSSCLAWWQCLFGSSGVYSSRIRQGSYPKDKLNNTDKYLWNSIYSSSKSYGHICSRSVPGYFRCSFRNSLCRLGCSYWDNSNNII